MLALSDKRAFLAKVESQAAQFTHDSKEGSGNEKPKPKIPDLASICKGINVLQSADVIVLNEVDWGVKRTGYHCVVCELGSALHMNWAWGLEFVDVAPMIIGTEKFEEMDDPQERAKMLGAIAVDKTRLRAARHCGPFALSHPRS
jgi:hypothetical protein